MELLNSADYPDISWAVLFASLLSLHYSFPSQAGAFFLPSDNCDKDNFILTRNVRSYCPRYLEIHWEKKLATTKMFSFNLISNFQFLVLPPPLLSLILLCVYSMCIILINVQKKNRNSKSRGTALFRKIYLDLLNLISHFFFLLSFPPKNTKKWYERNQKKKLNFFRFQRRNR